MKGADWRGYGRYGTVGIELIVTMALGYYGGRYLDARVGGRGWVTFAGFILGIVLGFRAIFAAGRHMERDVERAERADRGEDPWQDDGLSKGKHHDDGKPEP
jgi:F0F1-type ATP synthase assembly protein I